MKDSKGSIRYDGPKEGEGFIIKTSPKLVSDQKSTNSLKSGYKTGPKSTRGKRSATDSKTVCNNESDKENSLNSQKLMGPKSKIEKKSNKDEQSNTEERKSKNEKLTNSQQTYASKLAKCGKKSADGNFQCIDCGKSIKARNNFTKHLLTHVPESEWPFVCLFCGKHMQAKADLPKHFGTFIHMKDPRIPKAGTIEWDKLMKKSQVMEWPPKF